MSSAKLLPWPLQTCGKRPANVKKVYVQIIGHGHSVQQLSPFSGKRLAKVGTAWYVHGTQASSLLTGWIRTLSVMRCCSTLDCCFIFCACSVLLETSPYFPLGAQDQRLGAEQAQLHCGSRGTTSGNCMSPVMTAFLKPFFRTLWSVGNTMDGRETAGRTRSKNGYPRPGQTNSQWAPTGKTRRGSLLNHPSHPSDDPVSQGDWTELLELQLSLPSLHRPASFE